MKQWAADYSLSGTIESSAKEKKGLNAVFLTAFKSIFQYRAMKEQQMWINIVKDWYTESNTLKETSL